MGKTKEDTCHNETDLVRRAPRNYNAFSRTSQEQMNKKINKIVLLVENVTALCMEYRSFERAHRYLQTKLDVKLRRLDYFWVLYLCLFFVWPYVLAFLSRQVGIRAKDSRKMYGTKAYS